jgi:membrane-bound ClpP family serine protease
MSAAADPNIKTIPLTAEMAQSLSPKAMEGGDVSIPRRRSRKAKVRGGAADAVPDLSTVKVTKEVPAPVTSAAAQAGAGATSPGTMVQLAASHVPGANSSRAVGAVAPLTATGAPVGAIAPAATGGAKVVLAKSRKTKKVMLAAPKAVAAAAPTQRKKTAKKIKVSLKGLGAANRRAKTIRKRATAHSLEEIKKELVAAGLIKTDSKAPEPILRQMYADFMTLKKRAL